MLSIACDARSNRTRPTHLSSRPWLGRVTNSPPNNPPPPPKVPQIRHLEFAWHKCFCCRIWGVVPPQAVDDGVFSCLYRCFLGACDQKADSCDFLICFCNLFATTPL